MSNSFLGCLLALAVACPARASIPAFQGTERTFASGYAGSVPPDPAHRTGTYFDDPRIRELVYELEGGPVGRDRVQAAIEDTDFSVADLLRVGLLREKEGRFYIAFNYFDLEDMQATHRSAEKRVPALIDAYLARGNDFDEIFSRYPIESVPDEVLAFVLIGGFSLNWDALEFTAERGWRRPAFVKGEVPSGEPWQYSFWASELDPGYSTRAFFSASTTFPGGPFNYAEDPVDFSFSSFGDPYSDPRMSFPDLLYLPGEAMASPVREIADRIGLADRRQLGLDVRNALGLELGRSVAAILFQLRKGPRSDGELQGALPHSEGRALSDLLDLLEETRYIEERAGRYHLLIPVLEHDDQVLVRDALALSREILSAWLSEHYPQIRAELSGLTSLQHGVPFESLFTEIWHTFFGLATKELVQAGLMADPYADAVPYQGSLPTLWRMSVYRFDPG